MINAKELRLGNIVKYNRMYLRVTSINSPKPDKSERFNEKWVVELLCDGFISSPIEDIEPIPLTEEILLKCGFVAKKKFGYECKNFSIEIFFKSGKCCLYGGTGYIMKYLHQLQNLYFALTGEELEVNLS